MSSPLDRYRLIEHLFVPDSATAYWRGYDLTLDREVIIRTLVADDPRAAALREAARSSAMIEDRRLIRVLDVIELPANDSTPAMIAVINEWVQGHTLASIMESRRWEPLDVDQAVGIVWNQLKYKATLKREFGALPPVVCNAQLINQVVMNLLVNASHAMDTPGVITLSTRLEGPDAVITVADTGKGIAPAHVTRIFDPFFTTKEAGKGTGLGLSISADIIKKHGGDIRVESEVGVGTTFTIRIPVAGASG